MPDFLSMLDRFFPVKTDNLKSKYKNSEKEQIMNTIFSKLDTFDSVSSYAVDFLEAPVEQQKNTQDGEIWNTTDFINNLRDNILENGEISLAKIQKLFGQNVTINDVEQAFNDLLAEAKAEEAKSNKESEEFATNMVNAINDENLPEEIKQFLRPEATVDILEIDGKKYYSITDEEAEITIDYNEKGQRIRETSSFEDDGIYGAGEEILVLDEEGNGKIQMYKYDTGLIEKHDLESGKQTLEFGKTVMEYENTRVLSPEEIDKKLQEGNYKPEDGWKKTYKNLTVNQNLPNETKLDFELDENGNIKDIKLATDEKEQTAYLGDGNYANFKMPPIRISDKEKQHLIDLLNNGARLGNDFELKINGNKIEVTPTILDSDGNYVANIPNSVKNDVIELLKQGFRAGKDYNIIQNEDGSFKLDFDSQKAMGYEGDEKIITYSKDGKTKQTSITNGDEIKTITTDSNGRTFIKQESRSEEILMKLLEGDFNGANALLGDLISDIHDFNIYEVGIKYAEKTGKNLMTEAIKQYEAGKIDREMLARMAQDSYDIYTLEQYQERYDIYIEHTKILNDFTPNKNQVASMLPTISNKEVLSDTKYSQTINNKNYSIELKNNTLEITRDGVTKTINLEGIHPNLQKNILNCSPNVLFRLANHGSSLKIKDHINNHETQVMGSYDLITKNIELYTEVTMGECINRALAHEVGHSYYNNMNKINQKLEDAFNEELDAWQNSDETIKSGNATYCTNDIMEFVAEAYVLLATGESNGAYTICKHFPKTLALVKELVDSEDK